MLGVSSLPAIRDGEPLLPRTPYTLCIAHLCLSGAPEDNVNGHPFLSLAGVRFSTHLRKVLVAPTIPMEDQDSEEYCEATALAEEMMRPSGSHHE